MRIALLQLNPTVGDLAGNAERLGQAVAEAARGGAELAVTPELYLTGYPPRDLLERPAFVAANLEQLQGLARGLPPGGPALLVGFVDPRDRPLLGAPGAPAARHEGKPLHNAAALLAGGRVVDVVHKSLLPTYDVFDERRYFEPARSVRPLRIERPGRPVVTVGVTICEDIWNDPDFWPERLYPEDPIERLCAQGAELVVNLSASPFTLEKRNLRPRMLAAVASKHRRPLAFVNQVGGQDDLVFDGRSLVFGADGTLLASGAELAEDCFTVELPVPAGQPVPGPLAAPRADDEDAVLEALVLGTRDYARRCGFRTALLGVSGGIDSALVCAVAAMALGPEQVHAVSLPSRYSSDHSLDDARLLCESLGVHYQVMPIEGLHQAAAAALGASHGWSSPEQAAGRGLAEENVQSRARGLLLMALSNRHGHLLLTTGNKSEMAVGYCTLYGDMCGGLAVISDLPKTLVYRVARRVNARYQKPVIPERTFTKPPSAELRPDQTDQDSLPPYDLLDALLELHVERGLGIEEIVGRGHPRAVVEEVARLVRGAEYKRRQAAPGLKVTSKAFGSGRRYPIAQRYRG